MKCAWCGVDLTECKQPVVHNGQTFCPDPQCREEWDETYPKETSRVHPLTGRINMEKANIREVPKQPVYHVKDVVVSYVNSLGATRVAALVAKLADEGKEVHAGDELLNREMQDVIDQAAERCEDPADRECLEKYRLILHFPVRY